MSKLLLFSLFFFSFTAFCPAATAPKAQVAPDNAEVMITPLVSEDPCGFDRIQIDNSADSDHVCLNIHAFIFKTDDDRVPKLVGETTCMPAGRAKAKKVDKTIQPKLMPATGGSSF